MGPNQSADQTRHHAYVEGAAGRSLAKAGSTKNSMETLDARGGTIHLSRMQKKIWHIWDRALKKQKQLERLKKLRVEQKNGDSAPDGAKQSEGNKPPQQKTQSKISDLLMGWKTGGPTDFQLDPEDDDDGVIHLTIYVSDTECVKMPLDLTGHDSLVTVTSQWLHTEVFKMIKDKDLQTRSASHSKNTAGSTEPTSSQGGIPLEPVSLSTHDNGSECIDFLLTRKDEMIATFLQPARELKVNYVSKFDFEEDTRKKRENAVPSLRDFEFVKVIGKGGFATVYMVRKRTTGKLYAMKTVKKAQVMQNENRFAQVLRERNILSQLQNPFLVSLQYAFETTNYYCLVIDLCTGGELFYYLQKYQSFKLQSAKILFAEVLLAMEFLHENNILYRDLKPENILVDERGHLKLTDFGLCKHNFKKRDRADSFVGSPEYMSPEILLGKPYNFSVDYYTLGVLLFEMIVGLPPHYNEDKIQMYTDITMKKPVIPTILQGDIKDLLEGLLEINPENRLGMNHGIKEIKDHPFFSDIDWQRLAQKLPQASFRNQPLEVNILHSNFDREYTQLPVQIDPIEEELIRIKDPIQLCKSQKKRSGSFCFGVNKRRKIRRKNQQQSFLGKNQIHKGQYKGVADEQRAMGNKHKFPIHQSDEFLIGIARQGTPQGMTKLAIPQEIKRESRSVLMSERLHQEQNLTDRQESPGGASCKHPAYDDIHVEMCHQNSLKRSHPDITDLSVILDQKASNIRNSIDLGAYEQTTKGWVAHTKGINSAEANFANSKQKLPNMMMRTQSDRLLKLADDSNNQIPYEDTASAQFNYRKMTLHEDELPEGTQSELDMSRGEIQIGGNYNTSSTAGQPHNKANKIQSQELQDHYRSIQASQLKVTITKGLNRPEKPDFDAEKVTKEEILDEYTGTIGSCQPDSATGLNFTQRSNLIHSKLQKHYTHSPQKNNIEVTSGNESSSHMAWQPEMEQSLRKHEVPQFKAENSHLTIKVTSEAGLMTPNEIETPQPNIKLLSPHLNDSEVHKQIILEEDDNLIAKHERLLGTMCSDDYGYDEDQSSDDSRNQSIQETEAENYEETAEDQRDQNLLENILRSNKKRQKSEENFDGGMLIQKNQELPVFDLFNYGFSVEQESQQLKAKKNKLIKGRVQLKNFKLTPLICNKANNAATPFSNYSIKSKKLLNFTEKANEVISERNRVPRKQNLQLLEKKLLNDEEEENMLEETEGYMDEQIKPQVPGHHFSHHINFKTSNPLRQFKNAGYSSKPEMQLSQHLLQLPDITNSGSPHKSMKQAHNGLSGTQSPRQQRLVTSRSNDCLIPVNEMADDSNKTPKMLHLRRKQSSGDKSHVFVMSLNKTTQSRDEFSTSNKADAKIDQCSQVRQSTSTIKSPDKNKTVQTVFKHFTFRSVRSGNLSSSRNKMERINSHASETFEDRTNEVSTCKSPANKTKTEEKKVNISKQKTSVKKIIGKMGIQQSNMKHQNYSQLMPTGDKSDKVTGRRQDKLLYASDHAKDAYNKFPKNQKGAFGSGKPSIKSCQSQQSIVSKSHSKCSLAPNGPIQYFQGVLESDHPLFVTTAFESKQQQNLSQRSIQNQKTGKIPGPGSLVMNSPTTRSVKNLLSNTSPSERMQSPSDRIANTKAVAKHHTSFKQSKPKPNLVGNKTLQPNKTKPAELRKSTQFSMKTARQKVAVEQIFESPTLIENELQLRQPRPDNKITANTAIVQDRALIQGEQKSLGTKGRSKSDLKYGSSQKSLNKCFMTSESSFNDKRLTVPGNLNVQPFIKPLTRQPNNEKLTKIMPLNELIRSGSQAKREQIINAQTQSQANIVKNFPRTLTIFDHKQVARSNSANRTGSKNKKQQQQIQLDFNQQRAKMTRSLVGSEIFRRDMAQQMPQKRLPGQEEQLNGDSINITVTDTKNNEDATHHSMLQLCTQDKHLNETSVEELNLIAMADRSAIEATCNNISIRSSSYSDSREDGTVNVVDRDNQQPKSRPHLDIGEVSRSSKYSDNNKVYASEGNQITLTSQDFDDVLVHAQFKNDASMNYNMVHKKSFASNIERQKSDYNPSLFHKHSEDKFKVQDQKSPCSQKPDNRNYVYQSSSINATDNNYAVNFNFDKKKPPKTAYTTCNEAHGQLSSTFNDQSQSSDSIGPKQQKVRQSMVQANQLQMTDLQIDPNTCSSKQTQISQKRGNEKKIKGPAVQKNQRDQDHKAQALTPVNLKDPKSYTLSQPVNRNSTFKIPGSTKALNISNGTKQINSSTYYKQEEKVNTGRLSVPKVQGGTKDPGKIYLLENSQGVKNTANNPRKGDSALEYGKQSLKKNTMTKNATTVGSQQSMQSLTSSQNSNALPPKKAQKQDTMKNMVTRQKIGMKPNSLRIDQKQLTQPNEMRSSVSGTKKHILAQNKKQLLLSPKQNSASFSVQKSFKRENEKSAFNALQIPKSQSGAALMPLLSPQKLSSAGSHIAFNQSLANQNGKQRSRSNLQEPLRKSIGNSKQITDKESFVPSVQISEDLLRMTNTQSSMTHTPTTATINLVVNSQKDTPHLLREAVPNSSSALGVSTQNSGTSAIAQKMKPKKSIPSTQINLHDIDIPNQQTDKP